MQTRFITISLTPPWARWRYDAAYAMPTAASPLRQGTDAPKALKTPSTRSKTCTAFCGTITMTRSESSGGRRCWQTKTAFQSRKRSSRRAEGTEDRIRQFFTILCRIFCDFSNLILTRCVFCLCPSVFCLLSSVFMSSALSSVFCRLSSVPLSSVFCLWSSVLCLFLSSVPLFLCLLSSVSVPSVLGTSVFCFLSSCPFSPWQVGANLSNPCSISAPTW